jgi:hypothetical protein
LNLPGNNETPNPVLPSAAQLHEVRLKQWHQQGEALLTLENARSFLNAAGLVLFAPRPQIAAPAPSFVEAVLGAPNSAPTLAQMAQARELLARLVAEGLAVPLNLLGLGSIVGQPGDAPDFVASTAVFPYVFTLRGDKAWKQPPAGSGPAKVSNLAVAAHEALTQRGPLSAYDLMTELGKEVTEAAVLRALGELWMHLRVLPQLQLDGRATLWELSGARYIKQIKAGANAGQPTALSALTSLYLGQAIAASEDEVESFLSPLAARSRIRDVMHALLAARQLDTVAIEGRTMLHLAGSAPMFLAEEARPVAVAASQGIVATDSAAEGDDASSAVDAADSGTVEGAAEPAPRIAKFIPTPRKVGTGYLSKAKPTDFVDKPKRTFKPREESGGRPAFKPRTGASSKPRFAPRDGAKPRDDRERRPFVQRGDRERGPGSERPFRKPFGKPGEDHTARKSFAKFDAARPPRKPFGKPGAKFDSDRPARKPFAKFDAARPPRKPFGKPGAKFDSDRPARKPFAKFDAARPPRKPFSKPGAKFDSDRPARKPFAKFDAARPARKPFGKPGAKFDSDRPARKPFAKFDAARPARKPFDKPDDDRPRKPFDKSRGDFPPRKFAGKPGGFAGKPRSGPGGFADRKPFSKSGKPFAGRPKSGGAKFGGKKPSGKRPPAGRGPGPAGSRPPKDKREE